MQRRERIPKDIVEKYEDTICFMVYKDQWHMEAAEPRTTWIMSMGNKLDGNTLDADAHHLLSKLVDVKEERFGTYKEKNLDLHKKFIEP